MKMSPAIILAAALWSTTLFIPRLHADPPTATIQTDQLTKDSLKTMLDNLGYEPKALGEGWLISVKSGTWTLNVLFTLSKDLSKLGLNANLGAVANPDGVTAKQWMNLLVQNGNVDPSCFYFNAEQKKLYMHRALDNRGLTPVYMKKQVDAFCTNITETNEHWKFVE